MRSSVVLFCLVLILSGCESESDSTDAGDLPDVAGVYSFDTDTVAVNCDDGSSATNPPIVLEFEVLQEDHQIELTSAIPSGGISGVTIIDTTGASGRVRSDASFELTQSSTATFTGVAGTIALNYRIDGRFTTDSWSGDYSFTAQSSLFGFCRFSTEFTGSKMNPGMRNKPVPKPLGNDHAAFDFYDSSGILISLLGYQ